MKAPSDQPAVVDRPDNVFVSYARDDRDKIAALMDGLRSFGTSVWLDEALTGGQAWWEAILAEIRGCDVFVQTVSRASLDSEACASERRYASATGKPVLPVLIEPVAAEVLPSDLAAIQAVHYLEGTADEAFRLARALTRSPPPAPLPRPLPAAPPVPVSYLGSLAERVRAPQLSLDEQLALVARLSDALGRAKLRASAVELLNRLRDRDDLYAATGRAIDSALAAPRARLDGASPDAWTAEAVNKSGGRRALQVRLSSENHVITVSTNTNRIELDGRKAGGSFLQMGGDYPLELSDGDVTRHAVLTVARHHIKWDLKLVVEARVLYEEQGIGG
jgi:hypothetical protein